MLEIIEIVIDIALKVFALSFLIYCIQSVIKEITLEKWQDQKEQH